MWQVIGASSIGTSHVKTKTPCQDAHGFRVLENNCVIAAVADGLGSALRAEDGSLLAVTAGLDALAAHLGNAIPSTVEGWQGALFDAFVAVREKLEILSERNNAPLSDFATTLILVAMFDDWIAVGHIGDGAVVASAGGALETISPPMRGEFANETTPLTADAWMEHTHCSVYRSIDKSVALITDGLQSQSLIAATSAPFKPFFGPIFEAVRKKIDTTAVSERLRAFLDSERVSARTDDDKTLVVIGWLDDA